MHEHEVDVYLGEIPIYRHQQAPSKAPDGSLIPQPVIETGFVELVAKVGYTPEYSEDHFCRRECHYDWEIVGLAFYDRPENVEIEQTDPLYAVLLARIKADQALTLLIDERLPELHEEGEYND